MSFCPALRRIGDDVFICGYTGKSADPDLCYSENYVACPIYNEHERAGRTTCNVVLDKGVGKELENAINNAKERILISSPWIGRWYAEKLAEKALSGVKVYVVTSGDEKNKESVEILKRAMERGRAEEGGVGARDIQEGPREGGAAAEEAEQETVAEEIDEEAVDETKKAVKPSARKTVVVAIMTMLSSIAAYYLNGYPNLFYVMAALSAIAGLSAAYIVAKAVLYYNERLARREIDVDDDEISKMDDGASAELVTDEERKFGLMINDLVHAKLYIVDGRAWTGSANLTRTGMNENYETLVEIDVKTAEMLFDKLWKSTGGK